MGTPIGCKRKTPKTYMKKKPPKLSKLDSMMTKIMRRLAGGDDEGAPCEYCGEYAKGRNSHNHHGIAHRRYLNTRFMIENCAHVCGRCHDTFQNLPGKNVEWFKKRVGSDRYEQIEILARSGKKVDLEAVKEDLQKMLEVLNGGH